MFVPSKQGGLVAASALIGALVAAGPNAACAQAPSDAAELEALRQTLQQLESAMGDVRRRMGELERRVGASPPQPAGPPEEEQEAPAGTPPVSGAEAPPAAPGQFEVDEEAVDRALERALVRTGALLLPPGGVEVEPSLSYVRRESDVPGLVIDPAGPLPPAATSDEIRSNEVEAGLTLRAGLPFDSQVEITVPYVYEHRSALTSVRDATVSEDETDGVGFGDLRLSLAKGLLNEARWWPDLIGRVTWDSNTGQDDDGIELGSGFHELTGALTAAKRQDPLVFVGTASYTASFENDDIDPGDEFGFSLGTVLAASPETSLRFFLSQTFSDELEFDGEEIGGTDEVSTSLIIGASSIIAPRTLLDVEVGIGLTDDAPDYSVAVSLPIRFDLPPRF